MYSIPEPIDSSLTELNQFVKTFVADMATQLQSLSTIEEIHSWASTALPTFTSQTERRTAVVREALTTALQQLSLASASHGQPFSGSGMVGVAYASPNALGQHIFDAASPRSNRVQSIDTLLDQPAANVFQIGTRVASITRLQSFAQGAAAVGSALNPPSAPHEEASGGAGGQAPGSGTTMEEGQMVMSGASHGPGSGPVGAASISPQSISRPGSFSARMGSFTKKNLNGVDVPMLKDDASCGVVDALNDTYSLASRGSWRRRGPPSMFSAQHSVGVGGGVGSGVVHGGPLFASGQGNNNFNDMKRRAYLSFVQLDGMPTLNIDVEQQELRSRFSRPSKRHTAVFRDSSDLESLLDECNLPRIFDINSLEFNIFEEYQKYGDNAFTIVVMNVLLKYTFVTGFHFRIAQLLTFVKTVQSFYRPENPFHNALHAADVIQTTHLYLCQRDVKENFSDTELFALLFAALCIDVGHLGVNNHYLIKTRHPLATLYSDTSPMEAMSCALAFCILDDPDCNFLQDSVVWDREVESEFRSLVTDLILNSDDSQHATTINVVDEVLAKGIIADSDVPQLLAAVLHAADISYMCKPRHIYLEWAFRFMAENYRQGDAEAEYGQMYREEHPDVPVDAETKWLQISKLCDRNAVSATELQRSIMQHIVLPFITLLHPFLPSLWVERLDGNFAYLKEDEEEKTIVLQNGVQEQLWKKGIAPTWSDLPPNSGKNFLQVIRNWIAAELPEGEMVEPLLMVKQPSKVAAGPMASIPSVSNSSRPSNVSELDESTSVTSKQLTGQATLTVGSGGTTKKRLSVTQTATSVAPTVSMGLNSVHVLTGEMLKHMHTLLHAGVPGSWDASRETAIFAQEWVKLLRLLESQESGPALLSSLSVNHPLKSLSSTSHTSEEAESLSLVEQLRDQTSPFAHFRKQPPAPPSGSSSSGAAGADPMRRESVNDIVLSNSPFACAILLTQMWWIVKCIVDDLVAGNRFQMQEDRISTPLEPGLAGGNSDDELSASTKRDEGGSSSVTPPAHRTARDDAAGRAAVLRKDSMDSTVHTATPKGVAVPQGDAQRYHIVVPTHTTDFPRGSPPTTSPTSPPTATALHTDAQRQEVVVVPTPPQQIRDMMHGTRRPTLPPTGAGVGVGGDETRADPSPVKYVLQKRGSIPSVKRSGAE